MGLGCRGAGVEWSSKYQGLVRNCMEDLRKYMDTLCGLKDGLRAVVWMIRSGRLGDIAVMV